MSQNESVNQKQEMKNIPELFVFDPVNKYVARLCMWILLLSPSFMLHLFPNKGAQLMLLLPVLFQFQKDACILSFFQNEVIFVQLDELD